MSEKRKSTRGLVITVAGPHGSGRSTQAEILAKAFKLRYVSTGTLFRERAAETGLTLDELNVRSKDNPDFDRWLDNRAREETIKGGVVLDATLSGWMADNPDLRIYLYAPLKERIRRIAGRENFSIKKAERETAIRETAEKERFKEFYKVDLDDLSIYDVILNTGLFDVEACAHILKNIVEYYMSRR